MKIDGDFFLLLLFFYIKGIIVFLDFYDIIIFMNLMIKNEF